MVATPIKLKCLSDDNELQYVSTGKIAKDISHTYRYTKSISKIGLSLTLSESELRNYLKNNIFIEVV